MAVTVGKRAACPCHETYMYQFAIKKRKGIETVLPCQPCPSQRVPGPTSQAPPTRALHSSCACSMRPPDPAVWGAVWGTV